MSGPLPVWLPETAVNGSGRQRATDGRPLADEGQRSAAAVSRRTIRASGKVRARVISSTDAETFRGTLVN